MARIGSVAAAPFVGDQFVSLYLGAERVPTVPGKPVVSSVVSFSNEIAQATYSFNNGGLDAIPTFFFDDEEEGAGSEDATTASFDGAFLGTTFRMSVTNALGTSSLSDPVVVGGD
jgi:hypothetical protein